MDDYFHFYKNVKLPQVIKLLLTYILGKQQQEDETTENHVLI